MSLLIIKCGDKQQDKYGLNEESSNIKKHQIIMFSIEKNYSIER
ncbi:MAG: hypothetical protein ACI8W0_001992, partial [Flavobacterium sp.]